MVLMAVDLTKLPLRLDGIARAIQDQEADPENVIKALSVVVFGDRALSAQLRQRLSLA